MLPLGREVNNERHAQATLVQISLATSDASAMVAEEEYDCIVRQAFFLQVFQEESQPSIYILRGFQMAGIIGADFGEVGHIVG